MLGMIFQTRSKKRDTETIFRLLYVKCARRSYSACSKRARYPGNPPYTSNSRCTKRARCSYDTRILRSSRIVRCACSSHSSRHPQLPLFPTGMSHTPQPQPLLFPERTMYPQLTWYPEGTLIREDTIQRSRRLVIYNKRTGHFPLRRRRSSLRGLLYRTIIPVK